MSWQCRLIDFKVLGDNPWDKVQTGDMWFIREDEWRADPEKIRQSPGELSPEYFRDNWPSRPPLYVRLPGGRTMLLDSCYSGRGQGWTVTGDPPNITVSPSINAVGSYHGWLQNGVLSDDCEGRTFPS